MIDQKITPDNYVESMWQSLKAQAMPKDAEEAQIIDCKRYFFAGAKAVLALMHDIGGDDVPEDIGCMVLDGLEKELDRFAEMLEMVLA